MNRRDFCRPEDDSIATLQERLKPIPIAEIFPPRKIVGKGPPSRLEPGAFERYAADLARDVCGTQVDALHNLLHHIQREGGNPPSDSLFQDLVRHFVHARTNTLRYEISRFFQQLPWTCLCSIALRIGPSLAMELRVVFDKTDVVAKDLAYRIYGLLAHPFKSIEDYDMRARSQVMSIIRADARAIAYGILALSRKSPDFFFNIHQMVRLAIAQVGGDWEVKAYLIEACSLHPLPDDVVFHKVYTAVHTAISEMTRPSLIPPALFSLTRLHLTRRHNHQLSTSLLGLLVAHLLDSSSSNANSTSMSNITLSFLNRLTRKDIMTWGEMKEAGDTLVRAVAKGGVGDGLIDVVKFLTARGLASFMLKTLIEAVEFVHWREKSEKGGEGDATIELFFFIFRVVSQGGGDKSLVEQGGKIWKEVIQGLKRRIESIESQRVVSEEEWEDAVWLLCQGGKVSEETMREVGSFLIGHGGGDEKVLKAALADLVEWDLWDCLYDQILREWEAKSLEEVPPDLVLPVLKTLLRVSRGTFLDLSEVSEMIATQFHAERVAGAMEIDGGEGVGTMNGWVRYQIIVEAMVNGHFEVAKRFLSPLLPSSLPFSELTSTWLQVLGCISATESCCSPTSPTYAQSPCLTSYQQRALPLLVALSRRWPGFAFQRRFVEARMEWYKVMKVVRATCRELGVSGRRSGHQHTRLAKYETRIPWALLRLARLFDGLRKESLTFGAQTRWVLRSLVLACRFTSSLYQVLILQNFKDYKELSWPTTGPPARLPLICFCRSLEWSLMGNNITELKGTSLAAGVQLMLQYLDSLERVPFPFPRRFFSALLPMNARFLAIPYSRPGEEDLKKVMAVNSEDYIIEVKSHQPNHLALCGSITDCPPCHLSTLDSVILSLHVESGALEDFLQPPWNKPPICRKQCRLFSDAAFYTTVDLPPQGFKNPGEYVLFVAVALKDSSGKTWDATDTFRFMVVAHETGTAVGH